MTNELQSIEREITANKEMIARYEALERLRKNPDFNNIVMEGFFKDEAVRLVNLKAHPAMQKEENQKAINKDIDAIGSLYYYFMTIESQAIQAEKSLAYAEESRDEILQEGGIA